MTGYSDDDEENKRLAGCVTIAVAQILNYYQHPDKIGNYNINWNLTNLDVAPNDNTEIPMLIRLVNVGVKTQNGETGSSSNIKNAENFLKNYYSVKRFHENHEDIIKNELRNSRPVYVRGINREDNEGHAFICDGYYAKRKTSTIISYLVSQTNNKEYINNPYSEYVNETKTKITQEFFHINWGWGTYYDDNDYTATPSNAWFLNINTTKYNKDMQIMTIRRN